MLLVVDMVAVMVVVGEERHDLRVLYVHDIQ